MFLGLLLNLAKSGEIQTLNWLNRTPETWQEWKVVTHFYILCSLQTVVESGVAGVEGLAVDWIGENLYWIVSDSDQIEVCNLRSGGVKTVTRRTVVSGGGMESPRSLALDPRAGLLFWTDWDAAAPRIESCDMSGELSYVFK